MLILSAGMGAGHDRAAAELARRLAEAGDVADVADILELLPFGLGRALRRWYGWMIRAAPWAYALIYRVFFVPTRPPPECGAPGGRPRAPVSPLTVLAARRLRRVVLRDRPDEVVSAFHLAAQAAGYLRERGRLTVPSTVLVTDFAVHRLWLHPGNDRYLCPCPATALRAAALTGRPAACHAPLIGPEFHRPADDGARVRARLGVRPGDRLVLVSAGAWGAGDVEETARALARSGRYLAVVLCGRNDELRDLLERTGTGLALGWRDDLPELMAAGYALVDNAAGLTCREAFATGLPVVSHRPIPGHGHDGVLAMARAGLSVHARDVVDLIAVLDRLHDPAERARRTARGAALFAAAAAEAVLRDWRASPPGRSRTGRPTPPTPPARFRTGP